MLRDQKQQPVDDYSNISRLFKDLGKRHDPLMTALPVEKASAASLDEGRRITQDGSTARHKAYDWPRQGLCAMENLLSNYQIRLVRTGKFPMTVHKYLKDLRQFFKEMRVEDVDGINRKSIEDWMLVLRQRGRTTGTIANHLWAIKSFLRFLEEETQTAVYRFDIRIPFVKEPESIEFLEMEELERLYQVIDISKLKGLRLRTLIEVMISTGLRPTEALSLRRDDISYDEDTFLITGKGGKKREIYFTSNVKHWIRAYVSERKDDHPALFVTHCGPRTKTLALRSAEQLFQEAVRRSGIPKHLVLHTLRHTYATQLMANGCPADYIARLLGHSKVETTRRYYAAVRQKFAKAAHFRYLPYGREETESFVSELPQLAA